MATQFFRILLVLIAVAQVERPLVISSAAELSDTPPENRQEWLHPVIFEPQNKIQLTHSTYQVTTFLDFAPFVNGFNNVQNYIKNFKKDIHDSDYFSMVMHKSTNPHASPLLDEQDLAAFMQSAYCLSTPYACMTRLKIDRFLFQFSNSCSINKIKKNLRILQDQNLLQDKQIKALADHLNLTMAYVNRHENMLYELDAKLMILNKTLQSIMVQLSYFHYETNLINHMQLCINCIYTAVYALKEDIDALYEYMRVLSTQQLNRLIIPPDMLRYVLEQVKDGIQSNARLMLSEDPTQNIWTYYNIIKVTPIVMDDYLMVILTIPLIDSSLDVNLYKVYNLNLYKVYNLPMLHLKFQIQVEYQLEGAYFTMHMHGMYATIPKETDIKLCMMSQGHLCMFDEPLYLVEKIEWCLYALFMNDLSKIDLNCKFTATVRHTNLAHSLDGHLWAISSLATEKLQICCLHHTSVITIEPPLCIVDIGNGCEAFPLPCIYLQNRN